MLSVLGNYRGEKITVRWHPDGIVLAPEMFGRDLDALFSEPIHDLSSLVEIRLPVRSNEDEAGILIESLFDEVIESGFRTGWEDDLMQPDGVVEALTRLGKHLPGQHDQKTHGNWARGSTTLGGGIGASNLTGYLQSVSEFISSNNPGRPSLEGLILEHGQSYPAPSNEVNNQRMAANNVDEGELGGCYRNAQSQIIFDDTDLTYVEGLAVGSSSLPIPIAHAWLVTPDGEVIDPTWRGQEGVTPGIEYYGVPFDNTWLRGRAIKTEMWGVFQGTPVEDWDDAVAA